MGTNRKEFEMTEISIYKNITNALELAKEAHVGCEFTPLESIELLGYIKTLEESIGLDSQRIKELESELARTMGMMGRLTNLITYWRERAEKDEKELEACRLDMAADGGELSNKELRIIDLESELAQLKEANRWIPVGERLPGIGLRVTVWLSNTYQVTASYFGGRWMIVGVMCKTSPIGDHYHNPRTYQND
jgi:hypothetical protein